MYDDESKTGIKVYTAIFILVLFSFIGYIIFKSSDEKEKSSPKIQKRSQVKAGN